MLKPAHFSFFRFLRLFHLKTTETGDITSNSDGRSSTESVTSSRDDFATRSAFPNPGTLAFDGVLSAKDTVIGRVLRHLYLPQQLTKSTTVSGPVLSRNPNFLGALSHLELLVNLFVSGIRLQREGEKKRNAVKRVRHRQGKEGKPIVRQQLQTERREKTQVIGQRRRKHST